MSDSMTKKCSLFMLLLSSSSLTPTLGVAAPQSTVVEESESSAQIAPLPFASNLQDKLNGVSTQGQKVSRSFIREGCGYFAQIQVAVSDHEDQARDHLGAVEAYQQIFG